MRWGIAGGLALVVIACAIVLWPGAERAPTGDGARTDARQRSDPSAGDLGDTPASRAAEGAAADAAQEEDAISRARADGADADATWIVRGRVRDLEERGLADVPVHLSLHAGLDGDGALLAEATLTSDADGNFTWPLPPPDGSAILGASPELPEQHHGWGENRRVLAGAGAPQDLEVLVFPLDFHVTGTVRSHAGEPLAGATVRSVGRQTTADAQGRYDLAVSSQWSSPDVYADAPGHAEVSESVLTADAEGAQLDFALPPEFPLAGRVVDEHGRPIPGAEVKAFGLRHFTTETGADGRYAIEHLHPEHARHTVVARKEGFVQTQETVETANGPARDVTLVMPRGLVIEGRVVDARGRALEGAEVFAAQSRYDHRRVDALSDADGRFTVTSVPADAPFLFARREDFAMHRQELQVPDGARVHRVGDVVLQPGFFVGGRLVGPDGAPREDVIVALLLDGKYTQKRARSDANGRFLLEHLPPEAGDPALEIYGNQVVRERRPLTDDDRDRDDLEIVLHAPGGIAGRVVDAATGAGLDDFRIQLYFPEGRAREELVASYMADWSEPGRRFVDRAGRFTIDGEEWRVGRAVGVRASAPGYATREAGAVTVVPSPEPDALVIALQPARALRGVVLPATGGAAIERARVTLVEDAAREDPFRHGLDGHRTAYTDAHGAFSFDDLAPGIVWLRVEHPDWAMRVHGPVEIPESAAPPEPRILLGPGGGIRGHARDAGGEVPAEATVRARLVDAPGLRLLERSARVDADGAFALDHLAAGDHRVTLHVPAPSGGSVLLVAETVTVEEGAVAQVDLQPTGAAALTGRVEADEELPAGLAVQLHAMGEEGAAAAPTYGALTDADGRFRLPAIAPGRYRAECRFADRARGLELVARSETEVAAGRENVLVLRME